MTTYALMLHRCSWHLTQNILKQTIRFRDSDLQRAFLSDFHTVRNLISAEAFEQVRTVIYTTLCNAYIRNGINSLASGEKYVAVEM